MQGGVYLVRDERSSRQGIHASLRAGEGDVLAQKGLDQKQTEKIELSFPPSIW